MNQLVALFLVLAAAYQSSVAFAWGERGHHIVASMGARAMKTEAPDTDAGWYLARFFNDRAIQMGHLSNIPDHSWRSDSRFARVAAMNSGNHYFGPEIIHGPPGDDIEAFLQKVRSTPLDYAELKKQFEGKETLLPGTPEYRRKVVVYRHVGTTPWRTQELFDLLVKAFACAKSKETEPKGAFPKVSEVFRLSKDGGLGEDEDLPLPTYVCDSKNTRRGDLTAAVTLAGVMSHFIGDQGQPYHPTDDYNGWTTGNGGIHSYFESRVVRELDESLSADVLALAKDPDFRKNVWEKVGTDLSVNGGVVQLLLNLGADSYREIRRLNQLDDEYAILQKSSVLEWGDDPGYHSSGEIQWTKRRSPSHPEVMAAFRPLIVERLATSAFVLARVWRRAWELGGQPKLRDMHVIALPYVHDSPFIWPAYDQEALSWSKEILEESSSRAFSLTRLLNGQFFRGLFKRWQGKQENHAGHAHDEYTPAQHSCRRRF